MSAVLEHPRRLTHPDHLSARAGGSAGMSCEGWLLREPALVTGARRSLAVALVHGRSATFCAAVGQPIGQSVVVKTVVSRWGEHGARPEPDRVNDSLFGAFGASASV